MSETSSGRVSSISWVPTNPGGGASFVTHDLDEDGDVLRFVATRGAKLFVHAFFLGGIVAEAICVVLFTSPLPMWAPFIPLVVGGLFLGGAFWMKGRVMAPREFDLGAGVYRGRDGEVPLSRVVKLQLLTHTVEQRSSPGQGPAAYDCHELNLVLDGGDRRHVVAHGGLDVLREDAQTIADRLEVELLHREK